MYIYINLMMKFLIAILKTWIFFKKFFSYEISFMLHIPSVAAAITGATLHAPRAATWH